MGVGDIPLGMIVLVKFLCQAYLVLAAFIGMDTDISLLQDIKSDVCRPANIQRQTNVRLMSALRRPHVGYFLCIGYMYIARLVNPVN